MGNRVYNSALDTMTLLSASAGMGMCVRTCAFVRVIVCTHLSFYIFTHIMIRRRVMEYQSKTVPTDLDLFAM